MSPSSQPFPTRAAEPDAGCPANTPRWSSAQSATGSERASVGSWILSDLAKTAFSLGIISPFFPNLVKDVLHQGDFPVMILAPSNSWSS
jgi:MFS-type transporter involved in bile tolerance (Atg22 family)